jgi:Family of unknown function (DUF6010)
MNEEQEKITTVTAGVSVPLSLREIWSSRSSIVVTPAFRAVYIAVGPIYIAGLSLIDQPARRYVSAAILASAAFVYLGHGLGRLELWLAFTLLVLAALGSQWYPFIALGWVIHAGADIAHHRVDSPMFGWLPTSSWGCAVFDMIIAAWLVIGAPRLW